MAGRVSKIFTNPTGNRIIHVESRGKPNAKASTSTATGLGQFVEQTWFETIYKHGPLEIAKRIRRNPTTGKFTVPDGGGRAILDMRKAGTNKSLLKLNIDTLARFTDDNIIALGTGWNDGDVYLSHFAGAGTARKVMHANPDAPSSDVFGAKQIAANASILRGKTCGQVRAWAAKKMREWDRDGSPDYIGMYYPTEAVPIPTPKSPEAYADKPPVKIEDHTSDDEHADDAADIEATGAPEDAPEETGELAPAPAPTGFPEAPEGSTIRGDPAIWWLQFHLKHMNYYAGVCDGSPGGKLFGSITGFLTDWDERHGDITPPKTNAEFAAIKLAVYREVTAADAEGFKRPVSEARKNLEPEVVNQVAPEAATQKRGVLATVWGSIVTFVVGLWTQFADAVSSAFHWVMGNKDALPDEITEPSWIWAKLSAIPPAVWFMGLAGILAFVAYGLIHTMKRTLHDVQTGKR